MKNLKKSRFYRVGSAVLAAAIVVTCMPQAGLYAYAEEGDSVEGAALQGEAENMDGETAQEPAAVAEAPEETDADESQQGPKAGDTVEAPVSDPVQPADSQMDDSSLPYADGDPDPVPVTGITLKQATLSILRKGTAQLECVTTPSNANVGQNVKFESLDSTIATVAANGNTATITALKTGNTTIRVTAGPDDAPVTAECPVEVRPILVEGMTVEPDAQMKLSMVDAASKTAKLKVTLSPDDPDEKGIEVTDSATPGKKIVTTVCSGDGIVKEITVTAQKAGNTTLCIKSKSNPAVKKNIRVQVEEGPIALESLSVKAGYPKNLSQGYSTNLKEFVIFNPVDADDQTLLWSVEKIEKDGVDVSGNYAEVDQNGKVTAKWDDETDKSASKAVTIVAATNSKKSDGTTAITPVKFTINIVRNNVPLKAFHVDPAKLSLDDAGSGNRKTVRVQIDPLSSTDRQVTAAVTPQGTGGKTAVVINAGRTYQEDASATATAAADVNGWVYFTVTANELEGLAKQASCTITFTKKAPEASNPTTKAAAEITAKCDVTVNKFVESVKNLTLSSDTLAMTDQSTEKLTAEIEPLKAEDRHITWTVDDPEIASIIKMVTVDGTGAEVEEDIPADGRTEAVLIGTGDAQKLASAVKIQANMTGTCTITATAAGGVKKTCRVTVSPTANAPTELQITSKLIEGETTEITLKQGQEYELIPTITPLDADNKKVKWTSSGSVASVEKRTGEGENGYVTAKELGTCTITARASSDDAKCTKTVKVIVKNPELQVSYKGAPNLWTYTPADQPITEEMLRKELDVFFYPRENPIPEKDKLLLGSGDQDTYELRILREDGKTEKVYVPEDLEKAGTKKLVISYTYDGTVYKDTIEVTMKEFDEADLIEVTPLSGDNADIWNVPNGTSAAGLPLPETTEITVGREVVVEGNKVLKTSRRDAEIDWNLTEINYIPGDTQAQEFTVAGTVVLPDGVHNPDGVSLRVETTVHVREAASSGKKMARPKFSVLGGKDIGNRVSAEVPYGTKIEISPIAETENVVIYYMIDRRPDEERGIPHDEAHRYKSPIEVTAKTTTIYAVATKSGYDDSDSSECIIKLVEAQAIDPDDPNAGPLPDDVTDEDREQIGGSVPDGLWAVVQKEADEADGFAYTGQAIKPAVHVYDRTMLLTEKQDYTLAYSNNVNAGSAKGSAKPPTVTVTGKGNYEGKAVVYFTIKPQDINDDSVLVDEYMAAAYNGRAQKPNPALTWNGKRLSKNRDYSYTDTSYTEPGLYQFNVTGIGNYTGTKTLNYEIYQGGIAVSKLTVSRVANQTYTGSQIRPEVTVKNGKVTLIAGTEKSSSGNYWIKYENCTEVGNASIVIVGKGAYKGSKRINFKILPVANISKAGITLDVPPAGVAYTGKPQTPKCTVNYLGTELRENKDYRLSYQNNTKAGTATVVITGMGPYTGTARKTFKILQNDITGLTAVMGTSFAYEKGGCKPKPEVIYNGMKLQEGTDYTLTYRNNNKIGNTASVTVKGKGNYKGQLVRYFEVTIQDIANLKVVASDKVYQQRANIYKTKVQVIDLNGKALSAGSDYARDVYYTYENGSKAGQPVLSTDIIPAGTVIGVDVRVATPRCYQGMVHGTYRIVNADISGAKVSIAPQEYTGRSIRPKKNQIQVTFKGVLLGDNDYEIVGYENNVKQGNAKITIRGVGGYGGTKTATFKIQKKGILNLKF